MKKSKKYLWWSVGLLLFLLILLIVYRVIRGRRGQANKLETLPEDERIQTAWEVINQNWTLDTPKEFIMAQAMFETSKFTSNVFLENNNMFGMKLPKKRSTLATGENLDHATFKSLSDSVQDLMKWFAYTGMPTTDTIQEYVLQLKKRGYFATLYVTYEAGLKTMIEYMKIHELGPYKIGGSASASW